MRTFYKVYGECDFRDSTIVLTYSSEGKVDGGETSYRAKQLAISFKVCQKEPIVYL